ncbi:MAG: hypothetical protein FWF35_02175 [Elusimicrobia bacterium]|nr:hypothetical protein [Elusimicrobiota bacterium]
MKNKIIMLAAGILVLALCGLLAYNYVSKESRQKARRAEAEAKQAEAPAVVKKTALSDMNVANMVQRNQQAAQNGMPPQDMQSAQPGVPAGMPSQQAVQPGMPPQNMNGGYNPGVGNAAAEKQMTPDFATQKSAAPSAASFSIGDSPVKLIDILSGKTILSIPFANLGDPTLSKEDRAVAERARQARMQMAEQQRQAQLAEAQRQKELEEARQRELEAERRDPSRAIRNKIKITGIVAQEVFIGGGTKAYTVGSTVLGARIVSIYEDNVVFSYKGQRFTKKVEIK